MGSKIIFSHGSTNARNVDVLIKSDIDIVIENEIQDPKGRPAMLKAKIKDKNVNVYG